MDSSGQIHRFETEEEKEILEKEKGKLLELTEDTAKKLEELPENVRQAFYQAMSETNTRDSSYTKKAYDKPKARKKSKAARMARRKNR